MIKISTSKIQFTMILLVSLALSAFICFTKPVSESKKFSAKENETDKLNGPNEWFYLQRSYPDAYLDINAYHHSMQSISESINNISNHREKLLNGWNAAWTTEGPGNIGGRINVVTIDPSDNNIIYLGNSTGGVFKTTDGGTTWNSIFDIQSYLSVSSIVIQPGNHNTIYVGTGDANITGSAFIGDGIYKSTDGGATWNYLGLSAERIISKIVINPLDTNIIYAGTMGIPYFHDTNRGLYKSSDGGLTWNNILFVSDSAGIIDLVMDTNHPDTLYAASWNRIRNNILTLVDGYDAKIWKTTNGGTTWTALTGGLPQGDYSRISLSMSGINHNTLFASYSDNTYNLYNIYKTIDGGTTWTTVPTGSLNNPFNGQGWYSGGVHVNPTNDNELWLCGVDLYKTTNGGNTWGLGAPDWTQYIVHGDMHDVEFTNATTIYLTTDGGAYKTTNDGGNWTDIENLPNNQFYHITYDPINIGVYAGGVHDNGCTNGNASTINNWGRMNGGDGFGVIFHPSNSQVIWTESQNGAIQYTTNGGLWYLNGTNGINNGDVRNWDMQYIMSSANPNTLYTGTTKVYKNTGGTNVN